MRTVVILLLLANLTFFGYTRLDATSDGEAVRLVEQVQPDKIKLLTPQQVAALGPAKVAALADVCLEWGPLADADRARALADLESLALGKLLTQRRIETNMAFWVYLPPAPNRADAERRAAESGAWHRRRVDRRRRRRSATPFRSAPFATEDAAKARLAEVVAAGRGERQGRAAAAGDRADDCSSSAIRRRRSIAKLRDLVPAYPGSEAKIGNCEKAP